MAAPRKFDHDEARERHAAGETIRALAREYGVDRNAVQDAVNDEVRARRRAAKDRWQRSGRCPDCETQTTRNRLGQDHRCIDCASGVRATTVRPSELRCQRCGEWKSDEEFPRSRAESKWRRGRHGLCRRCQTAAKRVYRARKKAAA